MPVTLGLGFGIQLTAIALANTHYRSQTRLLTVGALAVIASFLLAVFVEWSPWSLMIILS